MVPNWRNQPWHLFLRRRALRSQELPWSDSKPTIFDTASGPTHAHYANKWSFIAFLVDNRKGAAEAKLRRSSQPIEVTPVDDFLQHTLPQRQVGAKGEVYQGVPLAQLHQKYPLRVLDLCSGLGSVPFCLEKLGVAAKVWECQINAKARELATARSFTVEQLKPHCIWFWASVDGLALLRVLKPRLIVAGFPCQSVSRANAKGKGQFGKSQVFEAVGKIVSSLRTFDWQIDFLVECTDFKDNHPGFHAVVCETLGVEAVVLEAADIGACTQKEGILDFIPDS